jgi:archaellum component FlaC
MEVSKLRQDLDEARNEIIFKESQLNSQRKLAKSMETQNKTQSTRIARLEDTIRDLKEQIETLRANPTASAISAVDETALEDLKAEIRELKGENEAMRENEDRARREFEE